MPAQRPSLKPPQMLRPQSTGQQAPFANRSTHRRQLTYAATGSMEHSTCTHNTVTAAGENSLGSDADPRYKSCTGLHQLTAPGSQSPQRAQHTTRSPRFTQTLATGAMLRLLTPEIFRRSARAAFCHTQRRELHSLRISERHDRSCNGGQHAQSCHTSDNAWISWPASLSSEDAIPSSTLQFQRLITDQPQ